MTSPPRLSESRPAWVPRWRPDGAALHGVVHGLLAHTEEYAIRSLVDSHAGFWAKLPELYLHGPAVGDFELALRRLLGEAAPLSEASLVRAKAHWQAEYESWRQRELSDLEVVYAWADGL